MKALHCTSDAVPGDAGFSLGNAHQKQREETEEHMGFDPVVLPVINRPQIQGCLEGSEGV